MPSKKILIIDDNLTFTALLKNQLKEKGYDVATAAEGFDGLSQIIIEDPDLIILDALMPKMNGLQFIKKLRENEPMRKIPVIMISGKPNIQEFFSDFIIEEFLQKPFDMPVLLEKIEKLIGKPPRADAGGPKRILIVTLDKYIRKKVGEYFAEAGWEVHCSEDHHNDAYRMASELYPDVILCQFWNEAWEGSPLDTKKLAARLSQSHLLAKIPLYVFCTGLMIAEAKAVFHEPQFVRYEKIADLLESLNKRLQIK